MFSLAALFFRARLRRAAGRCSVATRRVAKTLIRGRFAFFAFFAHQQPEKRKRAPLPERVTPVHQLVRPAHEPALHGALPVRQPPREFVQVERVARFDAAERHGGEPAEGVAPVRLRAGLARDASLVRLAAPHETRHAVAQIRIIDAAQVRDGERGVAPAHIRLAAVVHTEAARAFVFAPAEEIAHGVSVNDRGGGVRGDVREAANSRVRRREVRHLAGAAAEPTVGALAQRQKRDDVVREVRGQGLAEQRQRVHDPVAQPAPRRVQHDEARAEPPQGLQQVRDVLFALQHRDGGFPVAGRCGVCGIGEAGRHRARVDAPRGELQLPLRGGGLGGETETLHPETVHRGPGRAADTASADGSRNGVVRERNTRNKS